MKKEDIIYNLEILKNELDIDNVIILSGASLVLQDIIDSTSDIDLSCGKELYNKINWPKKTGAYGIEIKYKNCFEISYNLYKPKETVLINGYKCLNIESCYKIKKELNRQKDKKIIKKLEELLK